MVQFLTSASDPKGTFEAKSNWLAGSGKSDTELSWFQYNIGTPDIGTVIFMP
jgi:hypothetical protein